jgi:hypothetical protein
MYNMEISIGSYKCRLEICILAFVLFWIMFGHVMCSCCTMSMQEGLAIMGKSLGKKEGFVTAPVAKKRVYDDNHSSDSTTTTEGFVGSNNKAYGPEFDSSKSPGYIMRPDTWAMPTLSYSKGTVPSAGAQAILNRNNPPLAEGEMDIFANTPFKPECCPNTFSTGSGCACMDMKTYGTLINRGGNNVPYSEY